MESINISVTSALYYDFPLLHYWYGKKQTFYNILRNKTKRVSLSKLYVVLFAVNTALLTFVNLLIKLILILLKWKYAAFSYVHKIFRKEIGFVGGRPY